MIFSFVFRRPLSANSWSLNKRKCRSARNVPPSGKLLIGGEWASQDKRKYHSARKIPPSGKWPLLTVIVPLLQIQDPSEKASPMSHSAPIHIYLTTSINIRLTHSSLRPSQIQDSTKRPGLSEKAVRKCLLASLSIQKKNSLYIHGQRIPISCLLTDNQITQLFRPL